MKKSNLLLDGNAKAETVIILAHGAGQPMDAPFMNYFAKHIATTKVRVARFEFPYMARRRTSLKKPGPDREPKLRETWHQVLRLFPEKRILIGGKSMGGRIASLIADEFNSDEENDQSKISGVVCLGYPFHPVGKPDRLRTEHLKDMQTPTLIVQGTRDPFGTPEEVVTYELASTIRLHWLEDGEHSFKPRKKSGRTEEQNWREGVDAIQQFVVDIE